MFKRMFLTKLATSTNTTGGMMHCAMSVSLPMVVVITENVNSPMSMRKVTNGALSLSAATTSIISGVSVSSLAFILDSMSGVFAGCLKPRIVLPNDEMLYVVQLSVSSDSGVAVDMQNEQW